MLITIPAAADGGASTSSVLDLEPLLTYVRQVRPDAVSLMPPPGADDLPNGAALLTIKNRLETEGLGVIGATWDIPADAPLLDPGWQMQQLFEVRSLIAALGEAGIDLLPVCWRAHGEGPEHRAVMRRYFCGMLEEAERSAVRIAVYSGAHHNGAAALVRELDSPLLGVCYELSEPGDGPPHVRSTGELLLAVDGGAPTAGLLAHDGEEPSVVAEALTALASAGFDGPLLLPRLGAPQAYASAVRLVRGILSAQAPALLTR